MKRSILPLILLTSLMALPAGLALAGSNQIIRVDSFRDRELYCRGLKVSKTISLDVHAVGSRGQNTDKMAAYAWIIKKGSLRPAWEMELDNTERLGRNKYLRVYDSRVELEPGEYNVFFYAGEPRGFYFDFKNGMEGIGIFLDDLFSGNDKAALEKENQDRDRDDARNASLDEYELDVSSDSRDFERIECNLPAEDVIAEIVQPSHNEYNSVGFSLSKTMEVQITAIGEISGDGDNYYDYGWIIDAGTRKRVWSMEDANLRQAGGADKNKMTNERTSLPKGDYLLYYVTDDSHSFDDWNSPPPYNPYTYGIRVTALNKADMASVKPYQDTYSHTALLSITRAGDDFFETRDFKVTKGGCDVRVYAIGEFAGGDAFADYGWIEKEGEEEPYWEMTEHNTRHAGGASKNRMFDDVINLPPGNYTLGYMTDDSHSFDGWNSGPPYDQKNYGVSLFPTTAGFDTSIIQERDEKAPSAGMVLVKLTRVGDDADEYKSFSLDKPTRVRIYALGEGVSPEMVDYGWIEETDNDDIVWEMTYRKSKPAGGADKNRVVDTTILLDKGKYRVHYVSDGSHSFGDWNASPPRNPQKWGITVEKVE